MPLATTALPLLAACLLSPFAAQPASAHLFDSCGGDSDQAAPVVEHLYLVRADGGDRAPSEDEMFVLSAYAGLLARDGAPPRLALVTKDNDLPWLKTIAENTTDVFSLDEVLTLLPFSGSYALANLRDNSTSAALSYASAHDDVLPSTGATEATLRAHGAGLAIDLREIAAADGAWALDNLDHAAFNTHVSVLQAPTSFVALSDLAVKCRALVWFGDGCCSTHGVCSASTLAPRAFGLLEAGDSVVVGWGGGDDPEWDCVHAATVQGAAGVIAADFAYNLAVLSSATATTTVATSTTTSEITPESSSEDDKHTVCFLMSDGDNVQWILNDWGAPAGENGWWASPDRGSVPLGWTLSASLASLAPSVLEAIRAQATPNDQFVAGPSGAAYAFTNDFVASADPNPDDPAEDAGAAEAVAKETGFLMKTAGQRIVNVFGDEGFVTTADGEWLEPLLLQSEIDGIFLYEYNGYSELEGAIDFVAGKPVVGGRFSLWTPGFYDVDGLVDALTTLPNLTDVTTSNGYSLIPVHAWSHNVSDVLAVAVQLERDGRFDVVLPEEFLERIANRVVS